LESLGLVQRVHGGAVRIPSGSAMELSFFEKCKTNLDEKRRIGQKASEMVSMGDTLMLDAGTTTLQVAKHIKDKMGIHVVTNSIYILLELAEASAVEVSLTGGDLRKISRSLIGPLAGATGISIEQGLTSPNMIEAQTKSAMIHVAKNVILVADHTKFGKTTLGKFAKLEDIQILITDKKAPSAMIREIIKRGVEVVQV
jgi:DeoR family fructose operon transcriptional repressor